MIKKTKLLLINIIILFTVSTSANSSQEILKITKLPYENAEIEKIYKLDNGKFIYIEQYARGNIIWEYDPKNDQFKKISEVWTFIDLASTCEWIDENNIYFANILEYWFAGGLNIDYPEIRIFDLYEPEPWRDNDLGISPDMKYAKENCTFYKPYYIRE